MIRRFLVVAAALILLLLPMQALSQTSSSSLSGTITDASGGVLPGAVVTATNTGTNIAVTATSNSAGVYNFPGLAPGEYKVSAELAGFQTYTNTGVQLGTGRQIRLNFTLQVRKLEQSVEVSVAADMLLLESSSSVASVLPENQVAALPLVSNNALDLVKLMGGVVMGNNPVWDVDNTAFAGIKAANINVQRDGVTMNDVRYPTGINSPTRLNPDLVGEFRMVLSPIDAEMGRGAGQVQVLTRSGSNAYHGSLVWNIRNSAIDANTFYNNSHNITAPFSNQQEYTISAGGPIIKNKTFFYALWNQQISRQRVPINPIVLTPCAQKGIFRYYDNWNNGNINQITTTGGTGTVRVVKTDGTPTAEAIPFLNPADPSSGAHNGILRYASVFAPLTHTPSDLNTNCSDVEYVAGAPTWDAFRTQRDPSGWIDNTFLKLMPLPVNNYEVGDGLNVAGHRWNRILNGGANLWGVGEDNQRKQINVKIDHNFSAAHRLSGSWSYDRLWADDSYTNWPTGYGGLNKFNPQVLTAVLTSTLRPTLLNEVRFGMTRTGTNVFAPIDTPGSREKLLPLFPKYNDQTMLIGPGSGGPNFAIEFGNLSHFYGTSGILPIGFRDTSPRWTYADTIAWTKGRHSLKGGGELRMASSESITKGNWVAGSTTPYASGGSAGGASMMFNAPFAGMAGDSYSGNRTNFEGLANFLSGSIGQIQQYYFINSPTQTSWNDPLKEPDKIRTFMQNEFDLFFKDDWKVSDALTLNLGLRYEYYGVPHLKNGLTAALKGGGYSLFGPGGGFKNWMVPGAGDPNFITELTFVGPDSPNPDLQPFPPDRNNFGPAIGFAYQLPWLGKGKTTIRGGYQLSYLVMGRAGDVVDIMGEAPGMAFTDNWTGADWGTGYYPYLDLTMLSAASPVPIRSDIKPMTPIPITDRTKMIGAFDPDLVSPYIQNITLAVTRSVTSNFTVDLRYVGTLTRKITGNLNLNASNFLDNELKAAFDAARSGGESALLNQMFQGIPTFGGPYAGSGAELLRTGFIWAPALGFFGGGFTTTSNALATGDYQQLATTLNAADSVNFMPCGGAGCILRNGGFAENFIKTNPQFNTANFYSNLGNANYHGLQAQFTLRPTHGIGFQGTYTWSKNLGYDAAAGFTDPRNRRADYTLLNTHRSHTFTTYGTWDLPFGPNQYLLKSNNGVLSRIVGGWQVSWTGNLSTGMPESLSARSGLYGRGTPNIVGSFDPKNVEIYWKPGALAGNYFADRYTYVADPQCASVAPSLQATCNNSLKAVADVSSGKIILQNPLPGTRGNAGLMTMSRPNTWNVDMAMSKAIRITEAKSLSLRVDVSNVFNHVQPAGGSDAATRRTTQRADTPDAPNFNINSANPFGYLGTKVGYRMFQARARFNF